MSANLMAPEAAGLSPEIAALDGRLAAGLVAMGLTLSDHQRAQLLAYLALLERWNRAFNLTAIDQVEEMVARHLLDSLSIRPWLLGQHIVDSGTGAGLPGIPLAIACPDRQFTLIDSNGKKLRFLRQVRRELDLKQVELVQARLEARPDLAVPDTITARALAPLERLVAWHQDWLEKGARLLAMKSREVENELSALTGAYNVELHHLKVPGEPARRCLVIVTKQ